MLYTHQINININPNSELFTTETVKIMQGDVNTNKFIVTLKDDKEDYTIDVNTIARFMARKTDSTQVLIDCEIVNNKIEFILPTEAATSIGKVNCYIGLYDENNDKLLISLPFTIDILECAFKPLNVYSTNDYQSLTNVLLSVDTEISDMKSEVQSAIDVTSEEVTEAVELTEEAIENTNIAIQKTNDATSNANIATQATNKATDDANKAIVETKIATDKAVSATEKTITATQSANLATEKAIAATQSADLATDEATSAIKSANIATEEAITATNNCNAASENIPQTINKSLELYDLVTDGYHKCENSEKILSAVSSVEENLTINSIQGETIPYTGNNDVISPNNIAKFYNVGEDGEIEINISNENLFNYTFDNYSSIDTDKVTVTDVSEKSISISSIESELGGGVYYENIAIPPLTEVTLRCYTTGNNLSNTKLVIYKGKTKNDNIYDVFSINNSHTFITDIDCEYISIGLIPAYNSCETVTTANFFQMIVQFGPTVSRSYTENKSARYTIGLKDIYNNSIDPLRRVSDSIYDEIILKDDLWGVKRNCYYLEFTGEEYWLSSGSSVAILKTNNLPNLSKQAGYCTHYPNIKNNTKVQRIQFGTYYETMTTGNIYIYQTGSQDMSSFKQWLVSQYQQGTPVSVIYPLIDSEQTFTPLCLESQYILNNMVSINSQANIYSSDGAKLNINIPKGHYPSKFELNSVYPVGSIYNSTNNDNPNTILGGKWESISIGLDNIYSFKRIV